MKFALVISKRSITSLYLRVEVSEILGIEKVYSVTDSRIREHAKEMLVPVEEAGSIRMYSELNTRVEPWTPDRDWKSGNRN
jgi:hypothetical protein